MTQIAPSRWLRFWFGCWSFTSWQHLRSLIWTLTCDRVHSWWLYSAAPLGNPTISTMTWYPTESYYPDVEPTSPCPSLIILSRWLGSDKYQLLIVGLTRHGWITRYPQTVFPLRTLRRIKTLGDHIDCLSNYCIVGLPDDFYISKYNWLCVSWIIRHDILLAMWSP